ncbi:MAG: hypothetical protein ABIP80_01195 [Ferruginibacter sp.]
MKVFYYLLAFLLFSDFLLVAQSSSQLFDKSKMEYMGSKQKQAKLLMRKVGMWGKILEKEAHVDPLFLNLLDSAIGISRNKLKEYLNSQNVNETDVGGSIGLKLSYIMHKGKNVYAKYFVIHDVSFPVFKHSFPENINSDSWSFNNPRNWNKKVTHTYLTRTGGLNTVTSFAKGLRATKFELKILGTASKGLFIHVELIQPRVYPPGSTISAPVAPKLGFTEAQYKKLALLYICASVRKEEWLVPSFHVNIDEKLNDFHDDPQNFETQKFTSEVLELVSRLR